MNSLVPPSDSTGKDPSVTFESGLLLFLLGETTQSFHWSGGNSTCPSFQTCSRNATNTSFVLCSTFDQEVLSTSDKTAASATSTQAEWLYAELDLWTAAVVKWRGAVCHISLTDYPEGKTLSQKKKNCYPLLPKLLPALIHDCVC